jgi:hypothetical protein
MVRLVPLRLQYRSGVVSPEQREILVLQKRVLFTCLLILSASSLTQEHTHGNSEKLGTVHFATSCNGAAQQKFDRAVALLHSFEFSRAADGFTAALRVDPKCGIAYWGIALSQWSNLGSEQYDSTNSSIACRYPRWASAEVRLFRTADFA